MLGTWTLVISSASLLAAVITAGSPQQAPVETLPDGRAIVARHVAALGGAPAFKAIRSVRAEGRFEIVDRALGGRFELFSARPNRTMYRVTIPAIGVIENGFDGKVGWTISPITGPELLAGQQLVEAAEDAWFDAPLYESDHVVAVTTIARTRFDDRDAYRVRVTLKSGQAPIEYFDVSTGLQIGSEETRATPQGAVPTVNILRNYRRFGSVQQATTFVQRALGFEQVVTLTSIEYDVVPDAMFALPPAIAALVGR